MWIALSLEESLLTDCRAGNTLKIAYNQNCILTWHICPYGTTNKPRGGGGNKQYCNEIKGNCFLFQAFSCYQKKYTFVGNRCSKNALPSFPSMPFRFLCWYFNTSELLTQNLPCLCTTVHHLFSLSSSYPHWSMKSFVLEMSWFIQAGNLLQSLKSYKVTSHRVHTMGQTLFHMSELEFWAKQELDLT